MPELGFRTDFPYAIKVIEKLRIPLADGVSLAARLWLPESADPVPVLIEMHPYRAGDLFRRVDGLNAPYWAGHGYAVLRVDLRGSGDSGGLLTDEYTAQEIEDGAAIVAWAKAQSWCDGAVGLTGLSWPGFTALRVAARHPDAVQALMVTGVSDDGFVTDIHHLGGVPYVARVSWAGFMLALNAMPPDPSRFEGDWRAAWQDRLTANRSWLVPWLAHQTRDGFWHEKAVFGPARQSTTPLLVLGGLADKYKTPTLRLLAGWQGPHRGILGPWEHIFPHLASRQPAIGTLQEGLRWWDHWLKGKETGVMEEPALRYWQEGPVPSETRWTGVTDWPLQTLPHTTFTASGTDQLTPSDEAGGAGGTITLSGAASMQTALPGEDPYDDGSRPASLEDMTAAGGHMLTSAPLAAPVTLLSVPVLRVDVRTDGTGGQLAAWLLDLAPDGSAMLVTRGALNLAFSVGFDSIRPPGAGEDRSVALALDVASWVFPAGHRIVLVLAAQAWPILWPSPLGTDVTLDLATLSLDLPHAPASTAPVDFPLPESAIPGATGAMKWLRLEDKALPPAAQGTQISRGTRFAAYHINATNTDLLLHGRSDLELMESGRQARATEHWRACLERPGWSADVTASTSLVSTPQTFQITWSVTARNAGQIIHDANDTVNVPRIAY